MIKSIKQLKFGMSTSLLIIFLFVISFRGDNDIHFIEDKKIETFDQVINLDQFNDKVVYIDLWGTRCKPCIEEFSFGSYLKERFIQEPVEYLYLAVNYGHPDDETRWRKMVEAKNLTGYNMLISANLYKEIWNTIKDSVNTIYLIPHYIILNKKGKIAFADAARPSTKDTLYHQIELALKQNGL